MRYENLKVQTWQLQKAVEKLAKYGMDTFEMYADENDFSFCDRNRVISTCRISYNRPELREMACPDKLKNERWLFYTKNYSPDKARELIAKVDESYVNQFKPIIHKELTSGIG